MGQHLVAEHGAERAHGLLDVDHGWGGLVLLRLHRGDAADRRVVQGHARVGHEGARLDVALQQGELEAARPRCGVAVARAARMVNVQHKPEAYYDLIDKEARLLGATAELGDLGHWKPNP